MEAFSDGVLAIIITIMVLNLKVPSGIEFSDILKVVPQIGVYAMSFAYIGAYWNNHHHMLHAVTRISGKILWANLLFLFVISLLPFATDWFGQNLFSPIPTFVYGIVLFLTAISFFILRSAIINHKEGSPELKKIMKMDKRGNFTGIVYVIALGCAMFLPKLAVVLYTGLLLLWFMPDRKLEKAIYEQEI